MNSFAGSQTLNASLAMLELQPHSCFRTAAEAEKYADRVASRLGVAERVNSWWSDDAAQGSAPCRHVRYQDAAAKLALTVTISPGSLIENRRSFLLASAVERTDKPLRWETPRRLMPSKFERDVRELLARFRDSNHRRPAS